MSFYSIPNNLPDPLSIQPPYVALPLTRTEHISAQQILVGPTGNLGAGQLLTPLVLNLNSTYTGAFFLPPAFELANAFGNSSYYNPTTHFQTNAYSQVQPGDVFVVPIYKLYTNANTGTFYAGAGSTGHKTIAPYSTATNPTDADPQSLVIQFTSTQPFHYSYYLQ